MYIVYGLVHVCDALMEWVWLQITLPLPFSNLSSFDMIISCV